MNPKSFFDELKRRNVYKVAVAYTVVGWLLIQVATQVFPFFEIPNWAVRLIVLAIAVGLPIALVLAWAFELTPEGVKRTDDAEAAPVAKRHGGRSWIYIALGGAVASVALFFVGRHTAPRLDPDHARSIAVLPFENRSEDKANAYFADGIQDEILTRLAKIDGLKVISRTSTQRYKSSPDNIPEIARQLDVAHILEGSVQKSGEQVRVNVQLIRADIDGHIWAEVYDRKLTDIFAVQSDIAGNVAKALQLKLSGREQKAVAARPTENAEAYDAYLRGLVLWNSLTTVVSDATDVARHFSRAVELDPNFALGWAYLSVAQSFKFGEFDPTPERAQAAKIALERAQSLQPDLGEVHFAAGMYCYRVLRDFDCALDRFEKTRQDQSNRVMSIEFSSYVKRRQGKWEEALRLHGESLELDPRNPILLSEAALSYRALRRFDEAHGLLDRALEIAPENSQLLAQKAEIFLAQGRTEAASGLLRSVQLDGRDPTGTMAFVRFRMMQRQYLDAIRALQRVLEVPEKLPRNIAASYRAELALIEALARHPGAPEQLKRAREELAAIHAEGGETIWGTAMRLIVAGFLHDKATVEATAAAAADKIKSDAISGPSLSQAIAVARAHLGETEAALDEVERLLRTPGESSLTPALLRLDPLWDPLRGEPRFQKLVETAP